MRGKILWFNTHKQFGFIAPDFGSHNSDNIFFGRQSLPYDVQQLNPGAVVSFDVGHDRQGRSVANNLRLFSE